MQDGIIVIIMHASYHAPFSCISYFYRQVKERNENTRYRRRGVFGIASV